jgi:hypothetical protein
MTGVPRDQHGALIRSVGAALQPVLGSLASVTVTPPDAVWQVTRLLIRPTRNGAPTIGVWPDEEIILISVGDHVAARLAHTEGDPLTDITALILSVVRNGWTETHGHLWWKSTHKWPPYWGDPTE